jgi:hypothetical protein
VDVVIVIVTDTQLQRCLQNPVDYVCVCVAWSMMHGVRTTYSSEGWESVASHDCDYKPADACILSVLKAKVLDTIKGY